MPVKVVNRGSGQAITGKYAVISGDSVALFSGIMSDKKGGFRGCGKKTTFSTADVTVAADDPSTEIRSS